MNILDFIESLSKTDRYIKTIFMEGGCYKFHELLKKMYPESKPHINVEKNHVVTEYKGKIYDITGQTTGLYCPMTEDDVYLAKTWSFSRTKCLSIKECAGCGEPILF